MFLQDMHLAMSKILAYCAEHTFESFLDDTRTSDAVIRNLEVIGEAARNIPSEVKEKYPDVPWVEMYYLRNKLTHEYFGIDFEIIWDLTRNHLPENKAQIETIIRMESR